MHPGPDKSKSMEGTYTHHWETPIGNLWRNMIIKKDVRRQKIIKKKKKDEIYLSVLNVNSWKNSCIDN